MGASLETLKRQSDGPLNVEPLYPRPETCHPQPWRTEGNWSVAARVDHPDADEANRLARLDLEGGADALVLVNRTSPYARGIGHALATSDLDVILEDVALDFIGLRLEAGPVPAQALATFSDLVERRVLTSAALLVDVAYDPIGSRARLGQPMEDETARLLDLRAKAGLAGTVFLADGRPWHEAGADGAQELAYVLATALAYLRRLEVLGSKPEDGRRIIAFLLPADADVVLGLAKFRAIRRLWARVEAACGLEPRLIRLHAETSWRMMSRYDPWTNVMRATAGVFAAGLGGADVITALPHTLTIGLPDEAARRLARNIQRVLLDEAHLARVADPAAGSGAFEALTEQLCEDAWSGFQAIEREGGIERSLDHGSVQARIAETRARRQRDIAHRRHGIIGTSRFPRLVEPDLGTRGLALHPKAGLEAETAPNARPVRRDAEVFEDLRARADTLAASNERPAVFLATLGAPAAFSPRANAAINFFAMAGISAEFSFAKTSPDDLVAAFRRSNKTVVCLCGPDDAYRAHAGRLATAFRDAGARQIFLMGTLNTAETAGIDGYLDDGCDAVAILMATLDAVT